MVYLNVGRNNIKDINCLKDMKQLEIISFENNNVKDLTPLKRINKPLRCGSIQQCH